MCSLSTALDQPFTLCLVHTAANTLNILFPLPQALLLLHYLVRNGSERVVASAREHIYDMKPLEEYVFRDEQGKDQGVNGESDYLSTHILPLAEPLSWSQFARKPRRSSLSFKTTRD